MLASKGQPCNHHVILFFLLGNLVATKLFDVRLQKTTWWPLGRLMLDYERQLGGHQIISH
jgi:hypothetical protein